jgi:hypothetical protein
MMAWQWLPISSMSEFFLVTSPATQRLRKYRRVAAIRERHQRLPMPV